MTIGVAMAAAAPLPNKNHLAVTPDAYRDPEMWPCFSPYCKKPDKKYSRVLNVKPRIQWDDSGGYCGSLAIQNVALGKGVWVSQAVIRNSTVDAGGHTNQGGKGHEILAGNIDLALTTLKLKHEGFDWKNAPTPQAARQEFAELLLFRVERTVFHSPSFLAAFSLQISGRTRTARSSSATSWRATAWRG